MSMIKSNKNKTYCKENKVISNINYTIDTRKGKYITFIERQEIEYWRNNYPRKIFNYESAEERYRLEI